MIKYLAFFVFNFNFLVLNLKTLPSIENPNYHSLSFTNDTLLPLGLTKCFYLLLDISSMEYEETAVVTFNIPYGILRYQLLLRIQSKVIDKTDKDTLLNSFPILDKESVFEIENAYERRFNPEFKSLYHLYFNKTSPEKRNVFLLIDFQFRDQLAEYASEFIWISRVSRIEDITFKQPYDRLSFSKSLSPFVPLYLLFDLTDKYQYENVVFYCAENIMTVNYDGLIINNRINSQRVFNQIASSDQYYSDNSSHNLHKKFIMKFMYHEAISCFSIEVGYMRNPLMIIKSFSRMSLLPVEIIKQRQKFFIVEIFNKTSFFTSDEFFLSIEPVYGISQVHYSPSFHSSFIFDYIPRFGKSLELITSVKKMDLTMNFIQVSCLSPCRLNVVLFAHHPMSDIYISGVFYYSIGKEDSNKRINIKIEKNFKMELRGLTDDTIDVEFYNERNNQLIANSTLKDNVTPQRFIANNEYSNSNNMSLSLKLERESFIKVVIQHDYKYTIVPLGKSKYTSETLLFKFEPNSKVESYKIDLEILNVNEDSTLLNYFHEYYGFGNDDFIPFPVSKSLSFIKKKSIVFSNPFNKINQMIEKTDYKFYYYSLKGFSDIRLKYSVKYSCVYKEFSPILEINTLSFFNSNSLNRRGLFPDYTPNKKLILRFFRCSTKGQFDYRLWYGPMKLSQFGVFSDTTTFSLDNFHVDYDIDFPGNATEGYSFLFSYGYSDKDEFEKIQENRNYTLRHIQQGSNDFLQWNRYLISNNTEVVYLIYINEFKEEDNQCSFFHSKVFDVVYDNSPYIEKEPISYSLLRLKKGRYRVDMMAKENKIYQLTQVYEGLIVTIHTNMIAIRNLMLFISIVLSFCSGYLWYNTRKLGNNHKTTSRKGILQL